MCELFLPEGLAEDPAEDSALVDFFEAFLLDRLPVVFAGDSPLVPCIIWSSLRRGETGVTVALGFPPVGDASRVAFGDAIADADVVAEAVALGEEVADGDVAVCVCAITGAAARPRMASAVPHRRDVFTLLHEVTQNGSALFRTRHILFAVSAFPRCT